MEGPERWMKWLAATASRGKEFAKSRPGVCSSCGNRSAVNAWQASMRTGREVPSPNRQIRNPRTKNQICREPNSASLVLGIWFLGFGSWDFYLLTCLLSTTPVEELPPFLG